MIGDGAEGECRGTPPFVGVGNRAVWPIVLASETACIRFNPFSAVQGRSPKIANETILNTVFTHCKPWIREDGVVMEATLPRVWLIKRMVKAGMSPTPALARIKTLERRGLITSGERVWDGVKRLCVWPVPVEIPKEVIAEVREHDDIRWLRMIAEIATQNAPKSLRAMWRETQERTRESLTTASRRLHSLIAGGHVTGEEGAYWVKSVPPLPVRSVTAVGDLSDDEIKLNWFNPYSKHGELPELSQREREGGGRKSGGGAKAESAPEMTLE